jgi:hypothetical protein
LFVSFSLFSCFCYGSWDWVVSNGLCFTLLILLLLWVCCWTFPWNISFKSLHS